MKGIRIRPEKRGLQAILFDLEAERRQPLGQPSATPRPGGLGQFPDRLRPDLFPRSMVGGVVST